MNLVLSFVHPKKPSRTVGPFHRIRLDSESVRDDRKDPPIALHREHVWEVGGERYYRLDATTRVRIHFERRTLARSRLFGPYDRFSAVDGIAYADNRVFAFVDTKIGDWFCYDDGQHWPVMVVTDSTSVDDARLMGALAALAPLVSGVIGLWHGAQLLYLGSAVCLRSRVLSLLGNDRVFQGQEVSAVTWEAHAEPAKREAELAAEYERGAGTLTQTYGHRHGNRVRSDRLIARAKATLARGQSLYERSLARLAAA